MLEDQDVSQEVVSPVEEQANVSQQVEETQQQDAPQEDPQERNWREARQALKELRRQNDELRQQIGQMQSPKVDDSDEEESTDKDEWVTEGRLHKKLSALEQKIKQREAETVIDRLRGKYADFDDVVSEENIAYLKQHDPELAEGIAALKHDPYRQGLAAYKTLKRTDYFMNRQSVADKAKVAENSKKPVSVQAVRKAGALAEANRFDRGLTPELRKTLWQEMQEARKGA